MITITIDEEDFKDMLVERVKHWTDDEDTIELFEEYYDHMVYGGCFEGSKRSIAEIVDNDYVNNTSVITEEEYNKVREKEYQEVLEARELTEEFKPKRENYEDDEEYEDVLADFETDVKYVEEEVPTWDDISAGSVVPDFIDGYKIEAKTDSCMLVSY